MGIYIYTEFGGLERDIMLYFHKYEIKLCLDHNSSEIEKCVCTFFLLNNTKDINCDRILIKKSILALKEDCPRPIITLLNERDDNLIHYCCKDLKVFSFTLTQIEKLLALENKFFTGFEKMEQQFEIDIGKSHHFKSLYAEEIIEIFNKWIKCN